MKINRTQFVFKLSRDKDLCVFKSILSSQNEMVVSGVFYSSSYEHDSYFVIIGQ
jgi:hypothetical protein